MRINGGLQNCLNTDEAVVSECVILDKVVVLPSKSLMEWQTLDKRHTSNSDIPSSFYIFLLILWSYEGAQECVDLQTSSFTCDKRVQSEMNFIGAVVQSGKATTEPIWIHRDRMLFAQAMWAVHPLYCLWQGGDPQGFKHFSDNIIVFSKFSIIDLCLIQRIVILRLKAAIKIKSSRVYMRMISNFNWSLSFSSFILIWWDFPFFK